MLAGSSGCEATGALASAVVVAVPWDLVGPWLGWGSIIILFFLFSYLFMLVGFGLVLGWKISFICFSRGLFFFLILCGDG